MTQQERDQKRRAKDAKAKFEDLRMKAGKGTRQALADLMEWADLEEKGEAMTLMIHRLHELGREAEIHFLTPPRHKITISPIVARKLEKFCRREALRITNDDHLDEESA